MVSQAPKTTLMSLPNEVLILIADNIGPSDRGNPEAGSRWEDYGTRWTPKLCDVPRTLISFSRLNVRLHKLIKPVFWRRATFIVGLQRDEDCCKSDTDVYIPRRWLTPWNEKAQWLLVRAENLAIPYPDMQTIFQSREGHARTYRSIVTVPRLRQLKVLSEDIVHHEHPWSIGPIHRAGDWPRCWSVENGEPELHDEHGLYLPTMKAVEKCWETMLVNMPRLERVEFGRQRVITSWFSLRQQWLISQENPSQIRTLPGQSPAGDPMDWDAPLPVIMYDWEDILHSQIGETCHRELYMWRDIQWILEEFVEDRDRVIRMMIERRTQGPQYCMPLS